MDLSNDIRTSDSVSRQEVFTKIGLLTRQLHDALTELGYTDTLQGTVGQLPDAKSRLAYIARLTGEAAEKVLNRVDLAKSEHDHILTQTRRMAQLVVTDPVAAVAKGEVMNFVADVEASVGKIDQHLTEIMMAQDFHDLTGQVISKVVRLAETMEKQLVELLVQTAPEPGVPALAPLAELSGPVVNPEGRSDVVSDQSQVDDLLASLGF
jgi:chemotaxis protein CheZ